MYLNKNNSKKTIVKLMGRYCGKVFWDYVLHFVRKRIPYKRFLCGLAQYNNDGKKAKCEKRRFDRNIQNIYKPQMLAK